MIKQNPQLKNSVYCGGKMTQPMINQYNQMSSETHTTNKMAEQFYNTGFGKTFGSSMLSKGQNEVILRESEAEFKRRGNFEMIFPHPQSQISFYKQLFQMKDFQSKKDSKSINYLLHQRYMERGIFSQQSKSR